MGVPKGEIGQALTLTYGGRPKINTKLVTNRRRISMKGSVRTLFVVLAVLMSFTIAQAQGLDCDDQVVSGIVTDITETGVITIDTDNGDITVYGVPADWEIVKVDDSVVINAHETNDDKLIACYLTVNGGDVIELRPRAPEQSVIESITVALDGECTCDNCWCFCPKDCQDCTCDCTCECDCVGDANQYRGSKGD
jgi:hypothetical protein